MTPKPTTAADRCECGCVVPSNRENRLRCSDCGRLWPDDEASDAALVADPCWCCGEPAPIRGEGDPWEGRMDGYCRECAITRCDTTDSTCSVRNDLGGGKPDGEASTPTRDAAAGRS